MRGLSSPETATQGNRFGIIGMTLAIVTTLCLPQVASYGLIAAAIAAGGMVGALIAKFIRMTALPQLVAGFHSLVGLAAVLVASSAFFEPQAFGLLQNGGIRPNSLVEIGLGVAIGAITFTGSVATGHGILEKAARRGAKVQLEMGGKNPLVVLGDADLDTAVRVALDGAYFSTGQRCTASSRLIVEDNIHDRFVAALVKAIEAQVVDDARKPGTTIGPVVDPKQLKELGLK